MSAKHGLSIFISRQSFVAEKISTVKVCSTNGLRSRQPSIPNRVALHACACIQSSTLMFISLHHSPSLNLAALEDMPLYWHVEELASTYSSQLFVYRSHQAATKKGWTVSLSTSAWFSKFDETMSYYDKGQLLHMHAHWPELQFGRLPAHTLNQKY